MWLKFVSEHCTQAEYILKTDDDVFVNIFAVVDFLNRITQQNVRPRKSIMCFVWKGMDVIRDPKDKWYVNKEEYVPDIFPPYCSGAAYIITRDLIRPMYEQSFKIKFIWVDDFFITGALIEALQAEHFSINFLYAFEGIRTKEQLRHSSEYTFFAHSNVNLRLAMWKDVVKRQGIEIN
uniref:Hexosyltransferase n=1 Tax=Plectus sambesii TaxID=2011161 RepID=A0A914XJ01_9BILA